MEFKKVESEIFKFEKVGDAIQGRLISVSTSPVHENKVYKIQKSDGKVYSIFGTIVLQDVMSSVNIGDMVQIVFSSIKPNNKKGLHDIKMFEVYIGVE